MFNHPSYVDAAAIATLFTPSGAHCCPRRRRRGSSFPLRCCCCWLLCCPARCHRRPRPLQRRRVQGRRGLHPLHRPLWRGAAGRRAGALGPAGPLAGCLFGGLLPPTVPAASTAQRPLQPAAHTQHTLLPCPRCPQLFFIERRGGSDRSNKRVLRGDPVEAIRERAADRRRALSRAAARHPPAGCRLAAGARWGVMHPPRQHIPAERTSVPSSRQVPAAGHRPGSHHQGPGLPAAVPARRLCGGAPRVPRAAAILLPPLQSGCEPVAAWVQRPERHGLPVLAAERCWLAAAGWLLACVRASHSSHPALRCWLTLPAQAGARATRPSTSIACWRRWAGGAQRGGRRAAVAGARRAELAGSLAPRPPRRSSSIIWRWR